MPSRGGRGAIFVSGNSKCIRTSEWDRGVNFQFPLRECGGSIFSGITQTSCNAKCQIEVERTFLLW